MEYERLSDDDLATHRDAIAQMQAAQAVWQFWTQTVIKRYRLGPKDTISEDGTIHRKDTISEDGTIHRDESSPASPVYLRGNS